MSWSRAGARGGEASLRIDDLPAFCTGAVTPPIAIVPALSYRGSFWLTGEPTARATIFLAYYLGADADLQDYLVKTPARRAATPAWQEVAVVALAPAAATHARIWVYADQDSSGTMLVDDADLRLVAA